MNTVLGEILANRVLLSLVSDVFQAQFFGELADKRQEGCHYILYSTYMYTLYTDDNRD